MINIKAYKKRKWFISRTLLIVLILTITLTFLTSCWMEDEIWELEPKFEVAIEIIEWTQFYDEFYKYYYIIVDYKITHVGNNGWFVINEYTMWVHLTMEDGSRYTSWASEYIGGYPYYLEIGDTRYTNVYIHMGDINKVCKEVVIEIIEINGVVQ